MTSADNEYNFTTCELSHCRSTINNSQATVFEFSHYPIQLMEMSKIWI